MITRRGFLKAGGLSLFGVGLMGGIPSFLAEAAAQAGIYGPTKRKKILVCIFQRGAMDGLMAVTPFEDTFLRTARPDLFLSASKSGGEARLIDLDGRFGLHPALHGFEGAFREGRLAIVHGIGSPNPTRSHFDAQDYMESGTPFHKGTTSGWLNRAVGQLGHDGLTPFAAVSLTSALPRSLYGENPALAVANLRDFGIQQRKGQHGGANTAGNFEALYDQTRSALMNETGKETFEAMRMLKSADVRNYRPVPDANYPNSVLANALKQVAQLIKMDVGLEIAFTESNGWDTHLNQGRETGVFARNVGDLSRSIMAFWQDVERYQDDVVVMTMTEFGRTVHQNGTKGTDHGRASCNFILGNALSGGKVYGDISPLAKENLEEGRDLPVTTDFRAVFNEVAAKHLGAKDHEKLFPNWKGGEVGVLEKQ